jgi:hypothetical protein
MKEESFLYVDVDDAPYNAVLRTLRVTRKVREVVDRRVTPHVMDDIEAATHNTVMRAIHER